AVAHGSILHFRPNLRRIDPLDAIGALFHDSAAAHGDIRIAHAIEARRLEVGVEIEIETADLVGTVVRAIPRADATVVRHVVQAFGAVRGGSDRADVLARRVFALHAGQRLVVHLRVVQAAAEIGVDANPVHRAAARHLVLADDRDVVFGLARDHARVAADAAIQVDRHAPGITLV